MIKMKLLLTGAKGMVGRNLLDHPQIGMFDLLAPNRNELDLRDVDKIYNYLTAYKPDIIIHAAGKVGGIQANISEPVEFLLDNLDIGRNLVKAARDVGIKRLINLGSSCMYPRDHDEPLREEQVLTGALEPTNEGYALAKITVARLCEYVSRQIPQLQYKTLIPCNLYGPYDKFDPAQSHLIPAIIHKMHAAKMQGAPTVEIWGDGNARREFMFAGDFADALLLSAQQFDMIPSTMNIGLGQDYTINEYYRAAAQVVGFTGTFTHALDKPVGMSRKLVSIEQQQAWGWQPRYDLKLGMNATYEYYLKDIA
jgi:GDP-L-fucose synthase